MTTEQWRHTCDTYIKYAMAPINKQDLSSMIQFCSDEISNYKDGYTKDANCREKVNRAMEMLHLCGFSFEIIDDDSGNCWWVVKTPYGMEAVRI